MKAKKNVPPKLDHINCQKFDEKAMVISLVPLNRENVIPVPTESMTAIKIASVPFAKPLDKSPRIVSRTAFVMEIPGNRGIIALTMTICGEIGKKVAAPTARREAMAPPSKAIIM